MKNNTKGTFFIIAFKASAFFTRNKILRIIGLPIRLLYRLFVQWILGIDIPDVTIIGKNFKLFHGQGLVVNGNTVIGSNVTLRHNTTIGNAKKDGKSPKIGNNVEIGANCVVIGDITIGDNSIIAAGSVVLKDVPPQSLMVGNPARIVRELIYE